MRRRFLSTCYVPKHEPPKSEDVSKLSEFVSSAKRLYVLTGAGISTESGIPDYRSAGVGLYATSDKRPLQHQDFLDSAKARQGYWARNFIGWPRWSSVQPNSSHKALARWERDGKLKRGLVTQNVDQLHYKAGSSNVVELHGSNSLVSCLQCMYTVHRQTFQAVLENLNPHLCHKLNKDKIVRPDGDVELTPDETKSFKVPPCPRCFEGILKPKVVFFGDNVPKERIDRVQHATLNSDKLLIIGSSLYVFSGYRLVLWAKEAGVKVGVINIGPTRADNIVDLKVCARAGDVLPKISYR